MHEGPDQNAPRRMTGVRRPAVVAFEFEGHTLEGVPGETLAAALWAAGHRSVRRSSGDGEPRALFCNMGICFECLVRVDGRDVRACLAPVREGMVVERGGRPEPEGGP